MVAIDGRVSLSASLASHVATASYANLTGEVLFRTKLSILDALGVSVAASGLAPEVRPFVDQAGTSNRTEATILGFGQRSDAASAAFVNGALAHALDFEDSHEIAPVHPNAATVAAVLPLAERLGVSGRELLTATAVGCDLTCRVGMAAGAQMQRAGWYPPPMAAVFGATAGAARLLRLDAGATVDALSLAGCQVGFSFELLNGERSVIRAVRDAFTARAAVVSADLAARGVRGSSLPLEGPHGFLAMHADRPDLDALTEGLGARYEGERTCYKLWPCCRGTHPFIEAFRQLRSSHPIDARDILAIRAAGGEMAHMLSSPRERKVRPRTPIEAKFSIPFALGSIAVTGDIDLDSFSVERLSDPAVLAAADLVTCEIAPQLPSTTAMVEVTMTSGASYSLRIDHVPGDAGWPIPLDALIDKFRNGMSHAAAQVTESEIDGLLEAIMGMDEIDDVGVQLTPLLAGQR